MIASGETRRIEVRDLVKAFGATRAVDGVSFTVTPGTVTGFLGPNGAGKTTTLRTLLGLIRPDAGTATISGRTYAELAAPGSEVGAVLEASGFHPARTGRNHLRVYCKVNGYPAKRADEVLELVGLDDAAGRPVRGYSLGMRQRLALATALLGDPPVLVLDEPANGLDPEGIVWMRRLLREFADQGRTVLISSHVLSEMHQLVDDVVIINKGRLVRQGTVAELSGAMVSASVRTPQARRLLQVLEASAEPGVRIERVGSEGLRVTGMDVETIGRVARERQIELYGLTEETGSLEDVFFALTAETEGIG